MTIDRNKGEVVVGEIVTTLEEVVKGENIATLDSKDGTDSGAFCGIFIAIGRVKDAGVEPQCLLKTCLLYTSDAADE